jgi:type I restriction enzyme S subunit
MNAPMMRPAPPLGHLVDVLSGFAFKSEAFSDFGTLPIVRIRDVKRGYSETFYSGEYDDRYLVDDGDILVGMDGEFNRERWRGGKALLNQRVCKLVPDAERLSADYLYHLLPKALKDIEDRTPFATVKHLSSKDIKDIRISLPPLDEQRRIAAILDKADALRRKRKRALDILGSLSQSIFFEMFGDPVSNSKGWPSAKIKSIASKIGSGATPSGGNAAYKLKGISLVRSMNVRDEGFLFKGLAFIDEAQAAKLANVSLESGDVLLNITGASVARVCICPAEVLPARVNQHVSIIRLRERSLSDYVAAALKMPSMKAKLLGVAESGATRQAITKAQIEDLVLPLPPADKVDKYNNLTRRCLLTHRAASNSAQIDESLFSSLQSRAFSGQL